MNGVLLLLKVYHWPPQLGVARPRGTKTGLWTLLALSMQILKSQAERAFPLLNFYILKDLQSGSLYHCGLLLRLYPRTQTFRFIYCDYPLLSAMREEKMVFDYPLVDEQWVGAAPQYGYSNDNQGDIDVGPLSAHENPRPIRYGNRYVVPQEVCRRTAIMEYPPYGYEQTARRSSGSTTTSGVAYSTSGERSPTMRSYRPEPRLVMIEMLT